MLGYSSVGNVVSGLGLKEGCLQEMGQLVQEKPLDFTRQKALHCPPCLFDVVGGREAGGRSHGDTRFLFGWGLFSLSPTSFDELVSSLITCSFILKLPTSPSDPRPTFQETVSGLRVSRVGTIGTSPL